MKCKEFVAISTENQKKIESVVNNILLKMKEGTYISFRLASLSKVLSINLAKVLKILDSRKINDDIISQLHEELSHDDNNIRLLGFDSCVKKSPEEAEKAYESLKKYMRDMMEEGKSYETK